MDLGKPHKSYYFKWCDNIYLAQLWSESSTCLILSLWIRWPLALKRKRVGKLAIN